MLYFREILADRGIQFCYCGYITEDILSGIGSSLKQKLAMENTNREVARAVFSLFVEQVQNVIRYSAEKKLSAADSGLSDVELPFGLFSVGKKDDYYFVACGNMIPTGDVERLRGNLIKIQNMDKSELKALYKEILRGKTPEGSKGAGVGFIDIARRTTKGLEFDFHEINSEFAFFALKAYI